MEKFVNRIIETDRKAREIIEQAQQESRLFWQMPKNAPMLRSPAAKPRPIRDAPPSMRNSPSARPARASVWTPPIWTPSMRWTTPLRTGMTHGWPRSHKIRWPRCDARYA